MKLVRSRNRLVSFLFLAGRPVAGTSAMAQAAPTCDYPFVCNTTPPANKGSFSTDEATYQAFESAAIGKKAFSGFEGSAFAVNAVPSGKYASTLGASTAATGARADAFGNSDNALGNWSSAFGTLDNAYEDGANLFGRIREGRATYANGYRVNGQMGSARFISPRLNEGAVKAIQGVA